MSGYNQHRYLDPAIAQDSSERDQAEHLGLELRHKSDPIDLTILLLATMTIHGGIVCLFQFVGWNFIVVGGVSLLLLLGWGFLAMKLGKTPKLAILLGFAWLGIVFAIDFEQISAVIDNVLN